MSAQEPTGGVDPVAALQAVLAQNGALGPESGPPMTVVSYAETMNELLGAVRECASKARSAGDTREQSELAKGALAFAQAWVIMHPDLVAPAGVTADKMPGAMDRSEDVPGGAPGAPAGGDSTTGRPPQPTARRGSGKVKG